MVINMVINDVRRFDEFAESCGNRYVAVRTIAKWARDLGEKLNDYHISESKLIEIILNGKYYSEAEMDHRRRINDDDHIEDLLEWVIDDEIANEVRYLYRQSIRKRTLQYCSNLKFSQGEISKINILLRMLWYSTN